MLFFFCLSISPFTYDVHMEAINLFLVMLCPQMYPHSSSGILLKHIMTINRYYYYQSTLRCPFGWKTDSYAVVLRKSM